MDFTADFLPICLKQMGRFAEPRRSPVLKIGPFAKMFKAQFTIFSAEAQPGAENQTKCQALWAKFQSKLLFVRKVFCEKSIQRRA